MCKILCYRPLKLSSYLSTNTIATTKDASSWVSILRQKVARIERERRINSNNGSTSDCAVGQNKADRTEGLQGENIAQRIRHSQARVDSNKCSQSNRLPLANAFTI